MNFTPLRPVVFAELKVGDKLNYCGMQASVVYKGPDFVVLKYGDASEVPYNRDEMEDFKFHPLCWVENKPVYPGDVLYYKYDPEWKFNDKGVVVSSVRDDELLFHGGMAFPIADATWTKPKLKRVPSFQVEGVDVYPGDTVYYYGVNEEEWGELHTVKENGRVVWRRTGSVGLVNQFDGGAKAFRLKPQLVIGDHLVPMPEREAPAVGSVYYTPNLSKEEMYLRYDWNNDGHDLRLLARGLVHLTKEAAIAHGQAIVALSENES